MKHADYSVIKEIVDRCKKAKVKNLVETRATIENYFDSITWSLEKDEWNRMRSGERNAFSMKVFETINR